MEYHRKDRESAKTIETRHAYAQPLEDLLRKQRKGQFLTRDEKSRIQLEAEQKRKQNLCKK